MAESLSDKALAIFAFAAYHQLDSADRVPRFLQQDGAGHRADPEAVAELETRGLATTDGNRLLLSAEAQTLLDAMIEAMRSRAAQG